ncbi:MAG: magnesium transporter CorA family protein [Proteobacteria bacterium]|nr:magnesium transporter CorA family protein [Pseudomonadota bacterium]
MLRLLVPSGSGHQWVVHAPPAQLPEDFLWADLYEPTPEEERAIEARLALDVPTREEMREIETSRRLYEEQGALYLTATVATRLDSDTPESSAITFILAQGRLVTNRYVDTTPMQRYAQLAERAPLGTPSTALLAGMLEAFVERIADLLERVQAELDGASRRIFPRGADGYPRSSELHALIRQIGLDGDLVSKARESLVSFQRLLMYLPQSASVALAPEQRGRVRSTLRDVQSLSEHATFLGNKVQFLLDAVLGLINLEQNNIIKIFSVVAVMFMPPTLVASIYGMNFHHMPELEQPWGYPLALLAMVASALVPFAYFKRKGWL